MVFSTCPQSIWCSRGRPEFHLRQWVAPSSTRLSLVIPSATQYLHFLGNRGIQLHLAVAGNYPRIPGIALGLGLVHYPLLPVTHRFALLRKSGRSAPPPRLSRNGATSNMSQFRWFHARRRRVLLRRPAGFVDHRGRPYEKVPPPASFRSPVVNSVSRLQLTAPCSSLSLTRFAFRLCSSSYCYSAVQTDRGLPTLRRATCRTLW